MSEALATEETEHHLLPHQKLAYALGNFAVGVVPAPVAGLLMYFWAQRDGGKEVAFATLGAFAIVQLFGRLQDAFADPIVGYLSDRVHTRFGRRMPWIAVGTPLMLGAFVALWYPPTQGAGTANLVYLAVGLAAFWWGFTMVFAPYLSLLPEIETGIRERIRLSEAMAYFEVLGTLFGLVAVGLIIDGANGARFATLPEATRPAWGSFDPHGYHVMAWTIAALGLFSLLPMLITVRERGASEAKMVPYRFREAATICARNQAFRLYVIADGLFKFGFWLVVASLVFVVRSILHQTEGLSGILSGIPVIASAFLFRPCSILAERHGKKRVFLWALAGFALGLPLLATIPHAPFLGEMIGPRPAQLLGARVVHGPEDLIRTTQTLAVMLLISPSIAALYVLPRAMLADIVDADAETTGYRREAMYNGMWAIVEKTAIGLSGLALAALAYLDPRPPAEGLEAGAEAGLQLGLHALSAVGPLAGLFVALAWVVFRRYPIER